MTDTLRIAHCADIHLDGTAQGGPAVGGREPYRCAFAATLAAMREHDPHLMLIAGDLFDSNRATAETVEWAMEALGRERFPIVMIPGNHDCMEDGAIFSRYDFDSIPNVTMLKSPVGSLTYLPTLGVAAWGKGMVEHSPKFHPLGGCPERPSDCRWYVGLGHGLLVQDGSTDRSSPIYMREIEASPFDYVALGHHHAALEIVTDGPIAAYSGSPTDAIGRGATYVMADFVTGERPVLTIHTIGR